MQNLFDKIYWTLPYWLKDLYYSIRDFFFPRQKWLTKKIGRSWVDKVELIKIVAFESIIDFIEQEKALEVIEWNSTPDHKQAIDALIIAYQFARTDIPKLEKINETLWASSFITEYFKKGMLVPLPNQEKEKNTRYELKSPVNQAAEILAEIRKNDAEIEKMTQQVVETVAKYREYLWT